MQGTISFRCECCGMEFYNFSNDSKNMEKKVLTCPFCESELCYILITK